ncbi:TonB-dependent receptor [Fontimonas sp. SYSU GA230001]|uniref:TonB-dependent receptor plug domain-containing protein n=1 Tax=Fontimonas sp. SYSU GA230001 TaxID=3142450 RepID=UPI0032B315C8
MATRLGTWPLRLLAAAFSLSAASVLAQDADPLPEPEYGQAADAAAPDDPAATPEIQPEDQQEDSTVVETIQVEPLREPEAPAAEPEVAEGKTRLETIEVTGSRIRRSDYETAQPVLVVTRADIERSGLTSIGDLLQGLPQAGAALNTANNNGGNGAVEVDLRNLGSNRVLVLVNGRRWVSGVAATSTSSVDLNTIPISIIDSIEVLKDGASAVYGSDAIAGVINIKTRRDFEGGQFRAHAQTYDDGKGLTQSYSYSVGSFNGKTGVFMDVSYTNQGEVLAGDREESSYPTYGTGLSRGSSFTPGGRFLFVPTPGNGNVISNGDTDPTSPNALCRDLSGGVVEGVLSDPWGGVVGSDPANPGIPGAPPLGLAFPAGSALTLCDLAGRRGAGTDPSGNFARFDPNVDAYNYAPVNYLLTPSERTGLFAQFTHDFENGIHASSEVLYNNRKSAQRLAETPFGFGDALGIPPFDLGYVAADNPYNPTNSASPYYIPGTTPQDIGLADPAAGLVGLGASLRRLVEYGPRLFRQDVDTYRIGGGFDGQFPLLDYLVSWDLGAAYSQNRQSTSEQGLVNMAHAARALGPLADCVDTDTATAPPAAAGCVPLDIFGGPGTITPEMLAYITYTAHDTSRQSQRLFYGNATTNLPLLDGIFLGGQLGIAAGVELRTESFQSEPDPLKVNGTSSTNASAPTKGSYDAFEAYAELAIPLVRDVPLIDGLNVSLAARFSDYGEIGTNTSGKAGVEWRMLNGLLLRGTWSEAFRAPSITELYLGAVTSFPEETDPCASDERNSNPNVAANCDADGAADSQTNAQIPTVFGGNPDLKPETATSTTAGFVWSPEFFPDFSFEMDWYRIELKDFISFIGSDQIFTFCYRADPDSRSLCDRVQRSSNGELSKILATAVNFAALDVEGLDFNMSWKIQNDWLAPIGSFKLTADGAYVTRWDAVLPTVDGGEQRQGAVGQEFGGFGSIPRFKMNAALTWTNGPFEASWSSRFIYHVYEVCDDGRQDPGAAEGGNYPYPVLSLEQYGLCSGPHKADGTPLNKLDATTYHDVQFGYDVPAWNTKLVLGVLNVLDQDPPKAYSAFASTFDPNTYEIWGSRTPYLRVQTKF